LIVLVGYEEEERRGRGEEKEGRGHVRIYL
jgi:hypothetical protein